MPFIFLIYNYPPVILGDNYADFTKISINLAQMDNLKIINLPIEINF